MKHHILHKGHKGKNVINMSNKWEKMRKKCGETGKIGKMLHYIFWEKIYKLLVQRCKYIIISVYKLNCPKLKC